MLSPHDHERIERATAAAEASTCGEIVCVVADEASSYAEVALAWAASSALVLPLLVLAVANYSPYWDPTEWSWRSAHVAATHTNVMAALTVYALSQAILFVGTLLLVSIPAVRRLLTPGSLKRGYVHKRALEQFFAQNLHKTRDRTGVLIYASLKERRAEVITDTGIDAKVAANTWDDVIAALVAGMKAGEPGNGFVAAIEKCGDALALHFPAQGPKADELPDAIIEIATP